MFWVHLLGKDPQTGGDVDVFDCSFRWIPNLQVETSRRVIQVASAVDEERNLIHRGLTNQLTKADMAVWDDGTPRLNGEQLD